MSDTEISKRVTELEKELEALRLIVAAIGKKEMTYSSRVADKLDTLNASEELKALAKTRLYELWPGG